MQTKEEVRIRQAKYRKKNRKKIQISKKEYYNNNAESIKNKEKIYRAENPDKIKFKNERYYKKNKKNIIEQQKLYYSNRINNDSLYKMTRNIRSLVYSSFRAKGLNKKTKTEFIIGCSFKEYKQHINSLLEPWMNDNNYGAYNINKPRTWNIDHIIPIASAQSIKDLIKLNHYTNLRPFCSKKNKEKGASL